MKQLTLMVSVPDVARADIMITADRVYYRFATEDTLEDGDLPGVKEHYVLVEEKIKNALIARAGETPVSSEGDLRVNFFIDNVRQPLDGLTEESLRRVANELIAIDDIFRFVNNFIAS